MARVGAREQEEVVDNARESARSIPHHAQRGAVLVFGAMLARQRDIGLGAQDRRWGAQLMRGVGHETALLLKRMFEPVEEIVDDARQADEFVAPTHGKSLG